jgi:predicted dehydrogenase
MTEPLRVGLIGLGNVAVAHLEGYRQLDLIRVVAGADVRIDRAEAMADRYGFAAYQDYRELIGRERLDMVAVLSTVATHCEAVEAAADAGLHILCEKPLALTLAEADRMIRRCRERKVKLFYAASYRFLPPVVTARALIRQGVIGEVRLITETSIGGTGAAGYQDMGTHHYPAGGPGGSGNGLIDHGIHLVDLFPWLIGSEIVAVSGRAQRSGAPPIAEHLTMEFRSGATGHLIYDDATWFGDLPAEGIMSWGPTWDEMARAEGPSGRAVWQPHPGTIRAFGTTGTLRIFHYANRLFLASAKGVEEIAVVGPPMPGQFAAEMASFAVSIRSGGEPAVSGEDGRRALAVVLGIYDRPPMTRVELSPDGSAG